MKSILALSILLIQTFSFASNRVLNCRNEAHSAVTASIFIHDTSMKLKFGNGSDGRSLEEGIKNKTLNLIMDSDSSGNGWTAFEGDVLSNQNYFDYRTIQVRYETKKLESQSVVRVVFHISDEHSQNSSSSSYWSYGMICK